MMITYGQVFFELEHILEWRARPVYSEDGADYLYTHITLAVQFVINPRATFFDFPNEKMPVAIEALRQYLMIPRRSLTVTIGRENNAPKVVLQSPPPLADNNPNVLAACDARMGPQPLSFEHAEIHGTKTAVAVWRVETWIRDSNSTADSPLISHRWEVSQGYDQEYLQTRTINGRAVFRADRLYRLAADGGSLELAVSPDYFRTLLFHPLASATCRRDIREVTVESNGLAVRYSLVDTEQIATIPTRERVTRIKGWWKSGISLDGIFDLAVTYVSMVVRVWGGQNSSSTQLINAAIRVVTQFGFQKNFKPKWYHKSDLLVSLDENFVELEVGARVGGWGANALDVLGFLDVKGVDSDILTKFPRNLSDLAFRVPDKQKGQAPPQINLTRGEYLTLLVTQALSVSRISPPRPKDDVNATNIIPAL